MKGNGMRLCCISEIIRGLCRKAVREKFKKKFTGKGIGDTQ